MLETITDTSLALFFLKNPSLIKGFSKVVNTELADFPEEVYYLEFKKCWKAHEVHDALNNLTFELIPHFGCVELTHKLLTEAIIKAIDWKGKTIPLKVNYEITN